ncbi:MAG: DUF4864 domain-containing protein [Parcubacteria group bacterium]|nr:DUF4864 domain-containing protein [Parcubacteria group bacterium]
MIKKIVVVFIVLVTIGFGIAWFLTGDATKSADAFLSSIKNGDVDKAYQSASKQFKEKTTIDQFKSFVEGSSILVRFDSVFWNSRSMNNGVTTLEGNFKTKDAEAIPIIAELIKEGGQWKILNVDIKGGIAQKKIIPSNSDLTKLVHATISSFAQAINNDDFSEFYGSISKLWQSQITAQELRDAFKSFIDKKIDITISKDATPVFNEKPAIGDDELLTLSGYYIYPDSSRLNFQLGYSYEYPDWKLSHIKVSKK